MTAIIILPLLAYLAGSVCFGLLLSRAFLHIDIRKYGSGGVGATNVLRIGGKFLSLATLVLDFAKGFFVVWLTMRSNEAKIIHALVAIAVVAGHIFPIYFGFKGGKGVATAAAAILPLAPFVVIAAMTIWVIVALLSSYSSLAAITASLVALVVAWVYQIDFPHSVSITIIALLVLMRHQSNIKRLIKGVEPSIKLRNRV